MANASNYADNFDAYSIKSGSPLSAQGMVNALNTKEKVANKQTYSTDTAGTLTASSSDSYYPTSKLVGANLDTKENVNNKKTAIDSNTNASNDYYPTTKAVNDAITTATTAINTNISAKQDKIPAGTANNIVAYSGTAGTVNTLTRQTTVRAVASASDTALPTEKAVASAIASFLPVGTILMYDGTSWTDNVTLFGWYKCDGVDGRPNLVNKFLRGGTSSGATGDGKKTLSLAEMPSHTHEQNSHSHSLKSHDNSSAERVAGFGNEQCRIGTAGSAQNQMTTAWYEKDYSGNQLVSSETPTNKNAGGGEAFDVVPSYYTVIYIIKVA